jgi:hypothetical protein
MIVKNLNVGGFTICNCRWYSNNRHILFPIRYDRNFSARAHRVVFAYGAQVKRLRGLLETGLERTPRDRRPCKLKIGSWVQNEESTEPPTPFRRRIWVLFNFTVRGFTILGCRWNPESGSIQLPVTFRRIRRTDPPRYIKKPVVCAYGAHINRLRTALEAACPEMVIQEAA